MEEEGITIRGSIVGTRIDLQEALTFAGEGKVKQKIDLATRKSWCQTDDPDFVAKAA